MDEFLSEREQLDALRGWWRENGRWIIGGLVVGVVVLFGWRAWNSHQAEQAEAASRIYGELLAAMEDGDREQAASLRRHLTEEFAGTPYAAHAGLALARLHVRAGDAEAAAEALQEVLAATDDDELAHITRLRLARVHLQQDQPEAARQALTGVDEGSFAPLYADVRGDILAVEGNLAAARTAYRQALAVGDSGLIDRNLVQMKLDALGGAGAIQNADAEPAPAGAAPPAMDVEPAADTETPATDTEAPATDTETPATDTQAPAAGEAQPAPTGDAEADADEPAS